jgi:hypothetical protein
MTDWQRRQQLSVAGQRGLRLSVRFSACDMPEQAGKTASWVFVWLVPKVVQPPAKPMIMAMTAPQIRPHTPYFIFAALSGFIDKTS